MHAGFAKLGAPYTIARVDGSGGPQEVHAAVRAAVEAALAQAVMAASEAVVRDDSIAPEDKAAALRALLVRV